MYKLRLEPQFKSHLNNNNIAFFAMHFHPQKMRFPNLCENYADLAKCTYRYDESLIY